MRRPTAKGMLADAKARQLRVVENENRRLLDLVRRLLEELKYAASCDQEVSAGPAELEAERLLAEMGGEG